MLERLWDKLPAVRIGAVNSLSRLITYADDDELVSNKIFQGYRKLLKVEKRPVSFLKNREAQLEVLSEQRS